MRSYQRSNDQARPISFEIDYTKWADASVLTRFGDTWVLCTAFIEDKAPPWLRNQRKGWVTAEYGMLPGSTKTRMMREATRGRQGGRTHEISRLIGRSLRTCVNASLLGERTVTLDCDVLQADGGTRTAAITGSCLALTIALWKRRSLFVDSPMINRVAAVSLGICRDEILVDLDYNEDSSADTDLNLVMDQAGRYIEVQGTAEGEPFGPDQGMVFLADGAMALAEIHALAAETLQACGVPDTWVP